MIRLIYCDLITLFRIPLVFFFNNLFPLVMATVMILTIGNVDIDNGYHFVDKYFLISLVIALTPLTVISFPMAITSLTQDKLLERYYLFGIKINKILFSQIVVHFFLGIVEFFLVFIYLFIFFNLKVPNIQYFLSLLLSYILVLISMLTFGLTLGILIKRRELMQIVGISIMFIIFFLVGVFGSTDSLPNILKEISSFMPLKYLSQDSFKIWFGQDIIVNKLIYLSLIWAIIFSFINFILVKKKYKFR